MHFFLNIYRNIWHCWQNFLFIVLFSYSILETVQVETIYFWQKKTKENKKRQGKNLMVHFQHSVSDKPLYDLKFKGCYFNVNLTHATLNTEWHLHLIYQNLKQLTKTKENINRSIFEHCHWYIVESNVNKPISTHTRNAALCRLLKSYIKIRKKWNYLPLISFI